MRRSIALLAGALLVCAGRGAAAFSQAGGEDKGGSPIGHEWITAQAFTELIEHPSMLANADPRMSGGLAKARVPAALLKIPEKYKQQIKSWTLEAMARRSPHDEREAGGKKFNVKYVAAIDTIYGNRWVDMGGTDVVMQAQVHGDDCFHAIAQWPDEVQHDHFNRERNESGVDGAKAAIEDSIARFKHSFERAATATPALVKFIDGGITTRVHEADRNFFLFGRALHLFEDSFSPEHGIRYEEEGFRVLHGITSYVCTFDSEQHHPGTPVAAKARLAGYYAELGDFIWKTADGPRDVSNVRPAALAAVEATKELWAAFLRTMAEPDPKKRARLATAQADLIVAHWLQVRGLEAQRQKSLAQKPRKDAPFIRTRNQEQAACDAREGALEHVTLTEIHEQLRLKCLFNIEPRVNMQRTAGDSFSVEVDPHLHIPTVYDWKVSRRAGQGLLEPPDGWTWPGVGSKTRYSAAIARAIKQARAGSMTARPVKGTKAGSGK